MSEPAHSAPDHDADTNAVDANRADENSADENSEEEQAAAEDTSDVGTDPEEDPEAQQRLGEAEHPGGRVAVIGVVADPDLPVDVGSLIADELTQWLGDRTGEDWQVQVVSDPIAAGSAETSELFDTLERYRDHEQWRYVICVTDLPLLLRSRPLLAECSRERGLAVVSMPALGFRHRTPLRQISAVLVRELFQEERDTDRVTESSPAVARADIDDEGSEVRYPLSRFLGWPRVLWGMVLSNRPWRVVFGLSSALAAALATSAFGLSSTTIWKIGYLLPPGSRILGGFLSIAVLTAWLILGHGLWERTKNREGSFRKLVPLYNTTTVLTVLTGTVMLYVVLFAVNLGLAEFLVPPELLTSTLGAPPDVTVYLTLAWGFTSMGMLAGAVGSGLESDEVVRQVAYGYRERARRRGRDEVREQEQQG
ncbi:hypothetical protein LY13_004821 [Prauserella aidingensis]|uniref:hypothetical protein n=1 Tax=Prauserella aidingensis TaxID=387890 RepID=UPI0020A2E924|nr:hypothetical protein [Prauserella aidingensis]MCP2256038.1 hypothetical protein [Prauserella aidingensis]